tara:strand:- start:195747 stop:196844 length:1098 start_codon:yes stop_codon:yes gene_type:complete
MNLNELSKNLLVPPGEGVFTVNTAKERKDELHQKLFPNSKDIRKSWEESLDKVEQSKMIVLGVCSDTGGGILRGANWGPLFLRQTLHKDQPKIINDPNVLDIGDVRVIPHLLHDKYLNEKTITNCQKALYQNTSNKLPVSPLSITEHWLDKLYETHPEKRVFSIGGDHSVSYPLTKSYLKHKKSLGKKVAIIHFDAHTDLLIERLGIDLCFGSWCSHILEYLPSPDHLIQIGIRSSGKERGHWENKFGVQQYWSEQVIKDGADSIAKEIDSFLERSKVDELYISFDIDALDSEYASATGTPEDNGLAPHHCSLIIQELGKKYNITGADMVEIAPFLNTRDSQSQETTLTVGASLSAIIIQELLKN